MYFSHPRTHCYSYFRLCTLTDAAVQTNSICQSPEEPFVASSPSPPALSEEEARRIQEEQDAVSVISSRSMLMYKC